MRLKQKPPREGGKKSRFIFGCFSVWVLICFGLAVLAVGLGGKINPVLFLVLLMISAHLLLAAPAAAA